MISAMKEAKVGYCLGQGLQSEFKASMGKILSQKKLLEI